MVWDRAKPADGVECMKIRWHLVPYTRGRVLDIGCGPNKAFPHFYGVDNGDHIKYGYRITPDIRSDASRLDLIASQSCDAVFSSHLLEHIEDHVAALKEWWRVIKVGGHLCLYLPHKDLYPNIGQPGANPEHKHDFIEQDIIDALDFAGYDLVECQKRDQDDEYSMFLVFKKTKGSGKTYSCRDPKPAKTALVCRFGAFGDLMQASSVFAGLKKQGYHVSLLCSPPGCDVVMHDPNVDRFILTDKDQIPNAELGAYWEWAGKQYDKFVNLSETVEGTLLALPGRIQHSWPKALRHEMLNKNYLEFQHKLAGIPHDPQIRFYATPEEKAWARQQRERMGSRVVMWALGGSSVHKVNPHVDTIVARFMLDDDDTHVVLVGGPEPEWTLLERGWENERRVHRTCGKWTIRQTMSFLEQCDLIIGGETGVLNAACNLDVPKVVFLSHSSHENLTRDWKNTIALAADVPCYPCHQMHYGFKHCHQDQATGQAICQASMSVEDIWNAARQLLPQQRRAA